MTNRGYTLIELIIAVGLFSIIMTLASGAYFIMIDTNRRTQSIAAGVNDLAFALETMTRSIRTGASYACNGAGDCLPPTGGDSFSFTDSNGARITYNLASSAIQETKNGGAQVPLTDSSSITVNSLTFYVSGTSPAPADTAQPHVNIVVSGSLTPDPKKPSEVERFTIETGVTMRGADI